MKERDFQELIWQQGRQLYRDMPWRQDTRPYYVLVSEIMLQQTQVDRVIPKFNAFVAQFPDVQSLAVASLAEVLELWSGLGYNRRAKYLHEAAKRIVANYGGDFPESLTELQKLPGIGPGTAGALMVYAYNRPLTFIETNVRTVYFHHFFADGTVVSDAELRPLIDATVDQEHPREFYWALMDYGTELKRMGAGRLTQSRHYKKQSPLGGSVREVRGLIVKTLTKNELPFKDLQAATVQDERFEKALEGLTRDGLVEQTNGILHLTK